MPLLNKQLKNSRADRVRWAVGLEMVAKQGILVMTDGGWCLRDSSSEVDKALGARPD